MDVPQPGEQFLDELGGEELLLVVQEPHGAVVGVGVVHRHREHGDERVQAGEQR